MRSDDEEEPVEVAEESREASAPISYPDGRHPSGCVPMISSIVSTVFLGTAVDLKRIYVGARNAEYNPKTFAAVIMRIRDPKSTCLVFASGKVVCSGTRSESDSHLATRKFVRIIQRILSDHTIRFQNFRIKNMVASTETGFPIKIEELAETHAAFVMEPSQSIMLTYESEVFAGLIYRMLYPPVVLLIFVTGKMVITGARLREEIYEAVENIYPILWSFRKRR